MEKKHSNKLTEPNIFYQFLLDAIINENILLILPANFNLIDFLDYLLSFVFSKTSDEKLLLLVDSYQQFKWYERAFSEKSINEQVTYLNAKCKLEKREREYKNKIIIATAQIIQNDLFRQLIQPTDFSHLIFDSAHKATGSHTYTKVLNVFKELNSEIRILGITKTHFQKIEQLLKVCSSLLITKIEYRKNSDPLIQSCLKPFINRTLIVPLNRSFFELVTDLSSRIRQYEKILNKYGVRNTNMIRNSFDSFIKGIRESSYDLKKQQYLITLSQNISILQAVKETIESSSLEAGIVILKNLEQENTCEHALINTGLYLDLLDKLTAIYEKLEIKHPKHLRLEQLVINLQQKYNYRTMIIFANNKIACQEIATYLNRNKIRAEILLTANPSKIKELVARFDQADFVCLVTTKEIVLHSDAWIYYTLPNKFSIFTQREENNSFFLITHQSQEERLYHKFKNNEKQFEDLLNKTKLREQLIQNQKKLFDLSLRKKIDPRTKTLIELTSSLYQSKRDKTIEKGEKEERNTTKPLAIDNQHKLQFLAGTNEKDTQKLMDILGSDYVKTIEKISKDNLIPIFTKQEAEEIIQNIKKRLPLIEE